MKRSGGCIQQLRIQHGYTQDELAKALNIDRSYLSRIESGKKGCSVDLLIQLSELLNVSVDYILMGKVRSDVLDAACKERMKNDVDDIIRYLQAFRSSF